MEKISIQDLKNEFIIKNYVLQGIKWDYDNEKEIVFFNEIYDRLCEIKLIFNLCEITWAKLDDLKDNSK